MFPAKNCGGVSIRFRSVTLTALTTLLVVASLGTEGHAAPPDVADARGSAKVEMHTLPCEPNTVRAHVQSRSGIGSFRLQRKGDSWPATVELRLALRGLELLRIKRGKEQLEWSVDLTTGATRVSIRDEKGERQLPATDARHTKVRQENGFFFATIPAAWLKADTKQLDVNWIDFYR